MRRRLTSWVICREMGTTETTTVSPLGQLQEDTCPKCFSFVVVGFYVVPKLSSGTKQTNRGCGEKTRIGENQNGGDMLNKRYITIRKLKSEPNFK